MSKEEGGGFEVVEGHSGSIWCIEVSPVYIVSWVNPLRIYLSDISVKREWHLVLNHENRHGGGGGGGWLVRYPIYTVGRGIGYMEEQPRPE